MTINQTIDTRGLLCPIPLLRMAKAARRAVESGKVQTINLLATDPKSLTDIPNWCADHGVELLSVSDDDLTRLAFSLKVDPDRYVETIL